MTPQITQTFLSNPRHKMKRNPLFNLGFRRKYRLPR
uniref:Uncharacterized protein n=1 Tax=Arundo donax TaxID=35708 RepID=A0A0A9A0A3_ARUDO